MTKQDYLHIKEQIPTLSGVYTFRSKTGKPLYIGKARNLTNRIRSYFHGSKVPMTKRMLESAYSITWQETLSDIEALILESQSIKKFRPPFNTLMRDDKQYFYVGITEEQFPRVFITHQPIKPEEKSPKKPFGNFTGKISYVGPFTDGGSLKFALKSLRKIFPFCTCKQKHSNYCLNFHIGNCLGYCCLKNFTSTKDQLTTYRKNLFALKNILSGNRKKVVENLVTELQKNDAEEISIQITKLQRFFSNTKVLKNIKNFKKQLSNLASELGLRILPVRIEGYDISNIQGFFATGSMVVFTNGSPDKNEYRKFKIKTITDANDTGMLREVLERRLKHDEWQAPHLILIDGGKGQVNVANAVIKNNGFDIPVVGLIKNEKHVGERLILPHQNKIISLNQLSPSSTNLLLQIDSEAHRFAVSYYRKRHSFALRR